MQYLILAVMSSVFIATVMRLGEGKIQNNMAMFITNYIICGTFSFLYMEQPFITKASGMSTTIVFGLIAGVLYLASFVLHQVSISKNGVALSATFNKLGVLIPTIMAIVIFREKPSVLQILGIVLAVGAILLINFEKEEGTRKSNKLLLLSMLVVAGITDGMANIYNKLGNIELKDHYLFITFTVAGICAVIMWIKEHQSVCLMDILFGVLIGVPNYFSSRFFLASLRSVPAVIAYPGSSVGNIVVLSIIGAILFKEKFSAKKLIALGIILVSLVLLNL